MNTFILLKKLPALPSSRAGLKKQQSALARELLPAAASQLTGQPATHFSLSNDYPPKLLYQQQSSTLSLAISHRLHWVAVAVSRSPRLGLDLEIMQTRDTAEQLDFFLNDAEQAWLQKHIRPDNPQTAFYLAWTAKEAAGKRHGHGWQSPDSVLLLPQIKPHLAHCSPAAGLMLAIAADLPLACAIQQEQQEQHRIQPRWQPWPAVPATS